MKEKEIISSLISGKKFDDLIDIYSLSMMDDIIFRVYLDNNRELATTMLRQILNKKDIVVKQIEAQKSISSLVGKSVVLDALAIDSKNRVYNIEMQKIKTKDIIFRAKSYLSLLNINNLDKGQVYSDIPETYVIFFCDFDIFKRKKQIYKVDRYIDGKYPYNDKEHIIYINCKSNDTSNALGKLIHDMKSKIGSKKWYNVFSKQDKKGEKIMSDFWDTATKMLEEKLKKEYREEAIEEGIEIGKTNTVIEMLKEGFDIEVISKIMKKPIKDIINVKEINNL